MQDKATIMATVLQVSAAVSALLLIFQGYYLSVLRALNISNAHQKVKDRYKRGITYVLAALLLSILVSLGATAWLIGVDLFWATIGGFALSILTVGLLSIHVTISGLRNE